MDKIEQAVNILFFLAKHRKPYGVTEISKQLGLNKVSTYRILTSLTQAHYIKKDQNTRMYTLGERVLELSLAVLSNIDLRSISLPYLQEIQHSTNETALLAIRTGLEAMFLEQVPSDQYVKYVIVPGRRILLWRGAIGKSILAFMQEHEINQIIDQIPNPTEFITTSDRKCNVKKLRQELNQIRARGFAMSISEQVEGAAAISSPIITSDNFAIGSISIIGSISRINNELAERYGHLLQEMAKKIGGMLNSTSVNGLKYTS
jgi:IclR family acetate operon transcriptional repressor